MARVPNAVQTARVSQQSQCARAFCEEKSSNWWLTVGGVTLCAFNHAEPAVKVSTIADEPDHLFFVEGVESAEQGEDRDRTERETDRVLAPLVSGERTSFRILQRQHICGRIWRDQSSPFSRCVRIERPKDRRTVDDFVAVENVERILHGEDLDGTEGGVDVWVVIRIRREGAYRGGGPDRRKTSGQLSVCPQRKERKKNSPTEGT
jgi:hypothetical protein